MFGEEWTARTIAATIIGLAIVGISVFGVIQGMNDIKEHRANTDIRRMAGMLEAVDHKPGTVVRLNFVPEYSIDVAEDSITLRRDSIQPRQHKINLHNDISSGSLDGVSHVCIRNDGGQVEVSQNCDLATDADVQGDYDDQDIQQCSDSQTDMKTEYDRFHPSSQKDSVLQETGDGLHFTPGASDNEWDFLVYQQDFCRAEVTLNFETRGHIRIELRQADSAGDRGNVISYMNTDARGEEHVWLYCNGCPGTEDGVDPVTDAVSDNENYAKTGVSYDPGKDYTFRVRRRDDRTTWQILEEGSEVFSITRETADFNRVSIVAWDEWAGDRETQDADVTIKEVAFASMN